MNLQPVKAVGEYNISSELHEAIRRNPNRKHYISLTLKNSKYHNVTTVVRSGCTSMQSLHKEIAKYRQMYKAKWGVEPSEVLVR